MLLLDPRQKLLRDAGPNDCVQGCKRLIHEQQLRFQRQDLGNGDALSLPAG